MLLALVGVTGVGKSYFKEIITKELGFNKVNTIRTRRMRIGEKQEQTGLFMTEEQLYTLKNNNEIIYDFKVFGSIYAYLKKEIYSNDNMIFEMHYTTIYDWKKIRPDIKTIYILPTDLEITKAKIKERHLSKEKEEERLKEIQEHYNKIFTDIELKNMFDYIIYNDYTKESENNIIKLVKQIMYEEKSGVLYE